MLFDGDVWKSIIGYFLLIFVYLFLNLYVFICWYEFPLLDSFHKIYTLSGECKKTVLAKITGKLKYIIKLNSEKRKVIKEIQHRLNLAKGQVWNNYFHVSPFSCYTCMWLTSQLVFCFDISGSSSIQKLLFDFYRCDNELECLFWNIFS